ncbi:outer membrane beta-barrel protein [Marilutibacter maris]|uniref:Outer membrane beta-barrel protein n=1 Tax=Marilutibacter maris TaxID=1605891 RepID=A0A2U9T7R1_9GAMM|nr:outer membrane beta-barrel protein [Lysobacter maris]AWV08776.1 hypothetical protein C9I47_3112 [Lysobacter maris]KAB8189705.1 outer membrane beta-barrel protein [Lysobacter maris]
MKSTIVLAAMLAAAPFAVSAEDLSYTYAEGGYARANIDERDLDDPAGNGGYLRGSIAVSPSFNLFGSYSRVSDDYRFSDAYDRYRVDIDLTQAELGIGYHTALGERLDFIAELAYQRLEVDADLRGYGSASDDFNGGRAAIGVRAGTEQIEGWIKAGYVDGGDFDGDFVGTFGGQYRFNPTWGLVGEVELLEDVSHFKIGVRASF